MDNGLLKRDGVSICQIKSDTLFCLNDIWQYMRLNQKCEKVDCLLVLGCHDLGVAHCAIERFKQGYGKYLLFSGGKGKVTQQRWQKSEADIFAEVALQSGIDPQFILLEKESTNTGQNVINAMHLLQNLGLCAKRIMLICKPYFERRAFATFTQHFPYADVCVTSQQIAMIDYLLSVADLRLVIELIVGDLQRIMVYPNKGLQIKQKVPTKVFNAYQTLVAQGFDRQLI